MAETTTKLPTARRIMLLERRVVEMDGEEVSAYIPVGGYQPSRLKALDALSGAGRKGEYMVVATLWAGEVEVETKTVATLKMAGGEPRKPRAHKPSAHEKAAAELQRKPETAGATV